MAKAPTVEDVARVAGVSRQTVSNVLNSPAIVRSATRERVEAAIAELGYRQNTAARALRTRRSSTIGVHLDPYRGGISGVVLDRFVHALTDRAGERRMRVLLYAARTPREEIERMRELAEGGEVDAFVITGTFRGDPRTDWLLGRDVPFVAFGRPWGADDVDDPTHLWVDVDGAAGTRDATRFAMERAGAAVAFLGWPAGSGTGDDRERGWRETAGPDLPRLVAQEDVQAARETVATALRGGERIDAIVCASDTLAVGARLAAASAGREDLLVVGFDNTPAAEALGIPSVEQLPEQVAEGALALLMGGGTVVAPRAAAAGQAHVLVAPRLVER